MWYRPYPEGEEPPERPEGEFPRPPLRLVVPVAREFEARGGRCVVVSLEVWSNALVVRYAEYLPPPSPPSREDLSFREFVEESKLGRSGLGALSGDWEVRDDAGL